MQTFIKAELLTHCLTVDKMVYGDDMIPLIYCDDALLICEKPIGVSSESPGLPDLIREQEGYPVFPVHRLDCTTGGVMVLARSSSVCTGLQRLFREDLVIKEYLAVISGVPETDNGSFSDLLYHDQRTNKTFVVDRMRKGVKEASCEWSVLQTVETSDDRITLVRVNLHSGRTHQIRIQFASRKFPLVGDRRYGSGIRASVPALWSARIRFPHPLSKDQTIDVSSLPQDVFPWSCFQNILPNWID